MTQPWTAEEWEDARKTLASLDPFTEDEGPEWQRIADEMEYQSALSDWESARQEEETRP